jgi:hypothetical protein
MRYFRGWRAVDHISDYREEKSGKWHTILNNGDDVGAVSGHVDEITTGAVGELNSENGSLRSDDIGNVRDWCSWGGTEVQDLGARAHVDVVDTTQDTSGQLGAEGVPDTVLCAGWGFGLAVLGRGASTNADALLAVNGLSGGQVLGDKEILLSASDENTCVAMAGEVVSRCTTQFGQVVLTAQQWPWLLHELRLRHGLLHGERHGLWGHHDHHLHGHLHGRHGHHRRDLRRIRRDHLGGWSHRDLHGHHLHHVRRRHDRLCSKLELRYKWMIGEKSGEADIVKVAP